MRALDYSLNTQNASIGHYKLHALEHYYDATCNFIFVNMEALIIVAYKGQIFYATYKTGKIEVVQGSVVPTNLFYCHHLETKDGTDCMDMMKFNDDFKFKMDTIADILRVAMFGYSQSPSDYILVADKLQPVTRHIMTASPQLLGEKDEYQKGKQDPDQSGEGKE